MIVLRLSCSQWGCGSLDLNLNQLWRRLAWQCHSKTSVAIECGCMTVFCVVTVMHASLLQAFGAVGWTFIRILWIKVPSLDHERLHMLLHTTSVHWSSIFCPGFTQRAAPSKIRLFLPLVLASWGKLFGKENDSSHLGKLRRVVWTSVVQVYFLSGYIRYLMESNDSKAYWSTQRWITNYL